MKKLFILVLIGGLLWGLTLFAQEIDWVEAWFDDFEDGDFIHDPLWVVNFDPGDSLNPPGPPTGKAEVVDGVLRMTDPSTAYFTNKQLLIFTFGNDTLDLNNLNVGPDFKAECRLKVIDDPTILDIETAVIFGHYPEGATSPYYFNFAPGRERMSYWFGTLPAPGFTMPPIGSSPEIKLNTWFKVVVEVVGATARAEAYSGPVPTGEWDFEYTIPNYNPTGWIQGFWVGSFLVDTLYIDDVVYYLPATPVGDDKLNRPLSFTLQQNYPNPFSAGGGTTYGGNPETSIKYSLMKDDEITIQIFNILGKEVRTLVNERVTAGEHTVRWDGRDNLGRKVSTGIFLYRLSVGEAAITKKMILAK